MPYANAFILNRSTNFLFGEVLMYFAKDINPFQFVQSVQQDISRNFLIYSIYIFCACISEDHSIPCSVGQTFPKQALVFTCLQYLLVTSNFSFSHSVFYPFGELMKFNETGPLATEKSYIPTDIPTDQQIDRRPYRTDLLGLSSVYSMGIFKTQHHILTPEAKKKSLNYKMDGMNPRATKCTLILTQS